MSGACSKLRQKLAPYVCDAEERLRRALADNKKFASKAQGTLLDINHGTYPYVTSSNTIAGGALANLGLSAKLVKINWYRQSILNSCWRRSVSH